MSVAERPREEAERNSRIRSVAQALLSRSQIGVNGVAVLAVLAVAAIAFFDFGPPLAFNDDYAYAWSARHLGAGPIYPAQTALALPQIVVGWLVAAPFSHDQRALRLSLLIFILPGAWAAYRLARRLGAGPIWGLVSPVVLLTSPIFFNLAVSFMSDIAYVALLLLACNAGVSWLEGNRGGASFATWAAVATLQRVFGIVLIPAMAIALVAQSSRTRRSVRRSEFGWLAIALVCSALVLVIPELIGVSAGLNVADRLAHIQPDALFSPLIHLPVVAGYLLLPFAGALSFRWSPRLAIVAVPGAALMILLLLLFPYLPGNIWTFVGPAPTLAGAKPPPLPLAIDLVLVGLCPIIFWLLGLAASGRWVRVAASDSRFVFLLATSGLQLLLLLPNTLTLYDRYYLPVLAPLVPMVCALAERHGRPGAAGLAGVTCVILLGLSVIYEQDYQSWQEARDQAARLAYRCANPGRVNAGYEANAVYIEIPEYETTGKWQLGRLGRNVNILGPPRPDLWLEFAGPNDSRPGVRYGSVASGKIVINGSICSAITADVAR